MISLTRLWPTRTLARFRLASLILASLNVLSVLPQVNRNLPTEYWLSGLCAILLLIPLLLITFLRQRPFWWEPVLIGPWIFLCGIVLETRPVVLGCVVGLSASQSLYGSVRSAGLRLLIVMTAMAGVFVAPTDLLGASAQAPLGQAVWTALLVPALFGGFVRMVLDILIQQEQYMARDALLAHSGRSLLGVTDIAEARKIVADAADRLCSMTPGLVLLGVTTRDGQLSVTSTFGCPDDLQEEPLPSDLMAGLDPGDIETERRLERGVPALDALLARRSNGWHAIGVGTHDDPRWMLAAAPRRLPAGIFDVLRMLITQLWMAETSCVAHAELSRLAHNDQLTTTPNRAKFFQLVTEAVDAAAGNEAGVALLIIDLDDFKRVNDTYGHAAGDAVLVTAAERMSEIVVARGVASRFGGDEFAVLLTGLASPTDAEAVAQSLLERLVEPIKLNVGPPGTTITVGASIGIVNAQPGTTASDLMRCADIAMYSAKAQGKNRAERYADERHGSISETRRLEDHLLHAIERDEIVLHYQPLIDLKTGRCRGVEALVRWNHPTLGLLLPHAFIDLAERHGHVGALGEHILLTAGQQLIDWLAEDAGSSLTLAVNISNRQLTVPGLAQTVSRALRSTGLPPERLTLEVIESETLEHELPRAQLHEVADLGVQIALDDFGGDHTSLAHLQTLPIHQLKVTRRTPDQEGEARAQARTQLIMSVSHVLRLETVAQDIDTAQDADWARDTGIDLAQGSWFAPPLPADRLTTWLANSPLARH